MQSITGPMHMTGDTVTPMSYILLGLDNSIGMAAVFPVPRWVSMSFLSRSKRCYRRWCLPLLGWTTIIFWPNSREGQTSIALYWRGERWWLNSWPKQDGANSLGAQ